MSHISHVTQFTFGDAARKHDMLPDFIAALVTEDYTAIEQSFQSFVSSEFSRDLKVDTTVQFTVNGTTITVCVVGSRCAGNWHTTRQIHVDR